MRINNILVSCFGFVVCKSKFYTSHNTLDGNTFELKNGINVLNGNIDDEGWGISYILSMYNIDSRINLFDALCTLKVNENNIPISDFCSYSCYMDEEIYPLFNSNQSVRSLVKKGVSKNGLNATDEDIRILFSIDRERFERPIKQTGNETFKAMAAVGYSFGKQIFCFPWMSKRRYNSYHLQLKMVLETLDSLEKTIIIPIGD